MYWVGKGRVTCWSTKVMLQAKALLEETDWNRYGTGRNPKCANCMAHCGYEATAVNDAMAHPFKALRLFRAGPRTEGPFAPDAAGVSGGV